jgi:hypothetical protein
MNLATMATIFYILINVLLLVVNGWEKFLINDPT